MSGDEKTPSRGLCNRCKQPETPFCSADGSKHVQQADVLDADVGEEEDQAKKSSLLASLLSSRLEAVDKDFEKQVFHGESLLTHDEAATVFELWRLSNNLPLIKLVAL